MLRPLSLAISLVLTAAALTGCRSGSVAEAPVWTSAQADGTYANPPLYGDFPDPDIIRVGKDFYFATTTFANSPGLTILHSRDLAHWEYAGHVMARLDGGAKYDLTGGNVYRNGVFAPSLRYHNGVFYVVVTPNGDKTRIYRARSVAGPWTYVTLDRGAFDPGLYFDEAGVGYIFTSGGYDGTVTLLTLNADYTKVESARKIYYLKGAEGSKVIRRGDYIYLFNAIPSRLGLTVSRAKSLDGPWETRNQIDDKTGGHQGALVDLPDGRDYGFVMRDSGAIGRMTNISPVTWVDGWPVWGQAGAWNQVPDRAPLPVKGAPAYALATSDEFSHKELGLQWQWNHNPVDAKWSLSERPGFLRLHPSPAPNIWTARNTLTQKGLGPVSTGTVRLELGALKPGDACGLGIIGKFSTQLAAAKGADGQLRLTQTSFEDTTTGLVERFRSAPVPVPGPAVYLSIRMDFPAKAATLSWSADAKTWQAIGQPVTLAFDWRTGTFQGPQYGIFCFSTGPSEGFADIDWFHLKGS